MSSPLGAYYAYDAANPAPQLNDGLGEDLRVDGVGAYYAYDATHEAVQPINGAALGEAAQLSDEALRAIVGTRRPLMVAGEWAKRVTDIVWSAPTSPDELTLLPITDSDIAQVRASAFGHELPMLAVLSPSFLPLGRARDAFVGTPYVFDHAIAIYNVADRRPLPLPFMLSIARLRDADDQEGGSGKLGDTARALGGQIVYMVALPARAPRRPLPPIAVAVQATSPAASSAPPRVPGAPPRPPTPDVIPFGLAGQSRPGFSQKGVLGAVSGTTMLAGGAVLLALGIGAAVFIKAR